VALAVMRVRSLFLLLAQPELERLYAERFPGRYHPGPRQLLLLIKDSGEMGGMKLRTGP
jgi:hypothetical protein